MPSSLDYLKDFFQKKRESAAQEFIDKSKELNNYTNNDLFSDTLDHYQFGDGKELTLSPQKIRSYQTIVNSENLNQDRLLNSLNKKKTLYRINKDNSEDEVSLDDLNDNDRVKLNDYYDVDHDYTKQMANKDVDLYGSLGNFKLRSKSNLEFVKSKDKLIPYGYVEHSVHDTYDFNKGTALNLLLNPLEEAGKAKTYNKKSTWKTYPVGVINVNSGKIDTSGVEWDPR